MGGPKIFFFQSCFFTLSDMFMTRINHKINKNHPNDILFLFLPNLYQILSKKGSKRAPPSASGHFWEFFHFFCANHLRNTFSSLYQVAGKIGKNVHFIDIPNYRSFGQIIPLTHKTVFWGSNAHFFTWEGYLFFEGI